MRLLKIRAALFAAAAIPALTAALAVTPPAQAANPCEAGLSVADYAGPWRGQNNQNNEGNNLFWMLSVAPDNTGAASVSEVGTDTGGANFYQGGGVYRVNDNGVLRDMSTTGFDTSGTMRSITYVVNSVTCGTGGFPVSITTTSNYGNFTYTLTRV